MEGIGQKKETDYIFDKTIKCDVCGKEFKTKQVRTGKARFIGTDDILKPLYEGIDTCTLWLCSQFTFVWTSY